MGVDPRVSRPANHSEAGRLLMRLAAPLLLASGLLCAMLWMVSAPAAAFPDAFTVAKWATPDPVRAGDRLTYTLRITNVSSMDLFISVVTDTLPAGATLVDSGGGTLVGGSVVSWTNTAIGYGEFRDFTFSVAVTQVGSGSVSNTNYGARSGAETHLGTPVTVAVVPGDPYTLSLVAAPNPAGVGDSVVLTGTLTDRFDNPIGGQTVSLTFDMGSIDGQPSGSTVSGTTAAGGQVIKTLAGITTSATAQVTASTGALSPAAASIVFRPGPPDHLSLRASPAALLVGGNPSTLTLRLYDAYQNQVDEPVAVTLTTSLGTLTGGGTSYAQTAAGGLAQAVLTSPAQAGVAVVIGSAAGLSPAITAVTFVPGAPAVVGLAVQPVSILADASSTACLTATVSDAYANPVSEAVEVNFAAGDGTLLPDSVATTVNGVATRTLRSSTRVGSGVPLTATASGILTPATASIDFSVGPAVTATASVSPSSTISAGVYATLTLTVTDRMGHPVPYAAVTVSGSLGQPVIFSPTGVLSPTGATDGDGILVRLLRSTQIGPVCLDAVGPDGALNLLGDGSAARPISIQPGPPAQAALTAAPGQLYAISSTTATVTATVHDEFGNPVAGYLPDFSASLGYLTGGGATGAYGTATRTLHSTTELGTAWVSVTGLTTVTPAAVEMIPGPVATATVAADSPMPYVFDLGLDPDEATLAIAVTDIVEHPITRPVNVTSTFGLSLAFVSGCALPDDGGVLNACRVHSIQSGTPAFFVDGVQASGSAPDFQSGDAHHISLTPAGTLATPVPVTAGVPFTFTGVAQDLYGNPVPMSFSWSVVPPSAGTCTAIAPDFDQCAMAGRRAGTAQIVAQGDAIIGTSTVTVTPGSAVSASVAASPLTVDTDAATPRSNLVFQVQDQYGNPVRAGITLAVTSTSGIGSLYGGPTDANGTASWRVESRRAGTATISVTNLITLTGQRLITFTPGVPYTAALSASPAAVPANGISTTQVTFTMADRNGNPVGPGRTLSELSAVPGTLQAGTLTTDAGSAFTRTLTAALGISTTVGFSAKYSSNPLAITGDTVRFDVGPLHHVVITPVRPLTVRAGQPLTLTATGLDRYQAPILSGINTTWNPPSPFGYAEISPDDTPQIVFTGTTRYPNVVVRVTATQPPAPGGRFTDTTISVLSGAPAAAQLAATPPTALVDGSPITFTVSACVDRYGNPADEGATITLTVHSLPQPRVVTGSISGGRLIASITTTRVAGIYSVTASSAVTNPLGGADLTSSDLALGGDTSVAFTPAAPYTAAIVSVQPDQIVADGSSTSTLRLSVRDAFGNPVSNGWTLALSTTAGTLAAGNYQTDRNGLITATLQAGLVVTDARLFMDGTVSGTVAVAGAVPIVPGPPYAVAVSVASPTLTANGGGSDASFDVRDQWDHPVSDGTAITPTLEPELGAFEPPGPACRTLNGMVAQTLIPWTTAGTATISIGLPDAALSGTRVITVLPGPAHCAQVGGQPVSLTVAHTTTLIVTVSDSWNNPVSATPITLTAPGDRLDGVASSLVKPTIAGSGQLTASLYSTVAGTKTLSLAGPQQTLVLTGSDAIVFLPDLPGVTALDASTGVDADGVTTATVGIPVVITATSRDAYSNTIEGWQDVVYYWRIPPGDAGLSSYPQPATRRIVEFLPFRPADLVNPAWFTATALGSSGSVTASLRVAVQPGPPAAASVTVNPASVPADGSSTYAITVSNVLDSYGNLVLDGLILSVRVAGRSFEGALTGGQVSGSLASTFLPGIYPILVARADGQPLVLIGSDTVTFYPGEPASVAINAAPGQIVADGSSTALVTVTVRDAYLNPVGDGVPVVLTTTLGTLIDDGGAPSPTGVTQAGVLTRRLRSAVALGQATLTADVAGLIDHTHVSFVPGAPAAAWLQAAPSQVSADGVSTAQLTVSIKDAHAFTVLGPGTAFLAVARGSVAPSSSAVITDAAAQVSAVFTSATSTGSAGLSVIYRSPVFSGSLPVSGTLELVAGPADHAIVSASPVTLTVHADASCLTGPCALLTVRLWDSANRPVRDGTVVTVTSTLGSVLPDASTTIGGAVTRILYPGALAGAAELSVNAWPASGSWPAAMTTTIPIQSSYLDSIEVSPGPLVTTTAGISVQFSAAGYDPFHNPAGSGQFLWAKVPAYSPGELTSDTGVFASTTAGSVSIWAMQGPVFSPIVTVRVTAAAPATATVSANPTQIPAGGARYGGLSQLTISARDSFGNPVSDGTALDVRTNLGVISGTATTRGGGLMRTLESGLTPGTAILRVHNLVGGVQTAAGDQVTIVKGGPVTSTLTAWPAALVADGTSLAHLIIDDFADVTGDPVDGVTVTVTSDLGTLNCGSDTPLIDRGRIECTITSTVVGQAQITVDGFATGGDCVTFTAGPPACALVSADPVYLTADGVSTATLTITVQDAYSHTVTAAGDLTVSTTLGSISQIQPTVNGTTRRVLTSDQHTGTAEISVSDGAYGRLAGQGQVSFVGLVAIITANPSWLRADGASTAMLSIDVRDDMGQPAPRAGPLAVHTTLGSLSSGQPSVNGHTTRVLTASQQTGTAVITVTGASGEGRVPFVGSLTDGTFEYGLTNWAPGGNETPADLFISTYPASVVAQYPGYGDFPAYTVTLLSSDSVGGILITPPAGAGANMVRLGATTPDNSNHRISDAWLIQPVFVPPDSGTVTTLSYWYRMLSYDVAQGSVSYAGLCRPDNTSPPCEWDPFEVRLSGTRVWADGYQWSQEWQNWRGPEGAPPPSPRDVREGWAQQQLDLTPYAGQVVVLEFRVANHQKPVDNTWVYLAGIQMSSSQLRSLYLPVVRRD